MRYQLLKLKRGSSTKAERVFLEILKELKIPFRTKVMVEGREIDFLIGRYAIEIDGHEQIPEKNGSLLEHGLIPVHYLNRDVLERRSLIKEDIKQLWHEFETQD